VSFVDRRVGEQLEDVHSRVGDFALRRSDGLFAYQLAVSVDDLDQGITRVVRGLDLIASSGRQTLLRQTLAPEAAELDFLHVPLLFGADGERLSTRKGATSISDLRARGLRPEVVLGALAASLGLVSPKTEISAEALVETWSPVTIRERPLESSRL
jgi:glutamyl-tRNA synthetase